MHLRHVRRRSVAALSYTFITASLAISASASTASFVQSDTVTQGSWKGVYGSDGYCVFEDPSGNHYPTWANVNAIGQSVYVPASSTIDGRALLKSSSGTSDRIAALWYSATSETFDINLTDNNTHQVAFYFLDWGSSA